MDKGSEDATFKRVVRFFTLAFEKGSSIGKFTLSQKKGRLKNQLKRSLAGASTGLRDFSFTMRLERTPAKIWGCK